MSVCIYRFVPTLLLCLTLCSVSNVSVAQTLEQEAVPPPAMQLPTIKAPLSNQAFDSFLEREIATDESLAGPMDINMDIPLPVAPEEPSIPIEEEAFNAAVTGALPLSPDQIREFLKAYDNTQNAIQEPIYTTPEPKVIIETVSLDPGASPLNINTAVGYVTTLNFIDVTGEPWAIQDMGWAGEYEIIQPETSSHIIRVTPLTDFGQGNISVRLVDLKTPIILTLKTVRDEVHYRADLRIPELGPKAAPPVVMTPISTVAGKRDMTAILTGVLPQYSEKLVVSGVGSRTSAYVLDGATYVRTPHVLLSPGWSASVKSSDGTTVYQIGDAPVLLFSDNGRIVRAYLKKKEAINDF